MIRTPADGSRRPGLAIVGALLIAGFGLGYHSFLGSSNLTAIALASAFVLIGSIGTMALLVSGTVDLSIGSQYALVSVVTALVVRDSGSVLLGVVTAIGLGLVLGSINGILVLLLDVSPLIVTLGTLGVYGGAAYAVNSGDTVYGLPAAFTDIGSASVLGVPVPVVVALFAFAAGAFVLIATVTGLRLYAVGSNRTAAGLVGVRVNRLLVGTFAANGALMGLVGLLSTAQLSSGAPQVGTNFELNVLAAVILGGVAFTGGRGHPLGVFIAVAVIGVLNAGLIFAGFEDWWQQIAQGSLLLIALAFDQFIVLRRERRVRQGYSPPDPARHAEAERRRRDDSGMAGRVLEVDGLTVRYAGVLALDDVSLRVDAGEVVCLVGDNGAGKSTLTKAICGAVRPAAGTITVNSTPLNDYDPALAREAGIETVFQEIALCPHLSVADNLALGREPRTRLGSVVSVRDIAAADATAQARLDELGIPLADLRRPVRLLSGGERQIVQILRVMRDGVSLVIMDEPTSALGLSQGAEVRALVRAIAAAGTPVLLITHDVEEVFEVADRVAVLQRGELVFDGPIADVSRIELLRMMSGKSKAQAAQIMDAVSSERKRIERDLHDGAQQGLVNSALMLGMAIKQLRNAGDETVAGMLNSSLEALQTALAEMRDFSRGLYPTLLTDEGLVPAVQVLIARSPVPVHLDADAMPRLGETLEIAAYFVLAEALTNVLKHAQATEVTMRLAFDGERLDATVTDDGVGFEGDGGGSGLRGLRDRVAPVDGWIDVTSVIGHGTTVEATFPVAKAARR